MTKPKYHEGQWLTADGKKYGQITAYIKGHEHIYAIELPGDKESKSLLSNQWYTEFEIDEELKVSPAEAPDFKRFQALEAGDMLRVGESTYVTVLARVGDLVLFSGIPHKHEGEVITGLADQIKEMSEGKVDLLDDEERAILKKHGSSRYTARTASVWKPVDWVARMNWPVVEE